MQSQSELNRTLIPKVGSEYIKLKTGEMVKWESFDNETQVFKFRSSEETDHSIHRREVEIPTPDEEWEHFKSNKSSQQETAQ